tara:strand:+ start:172 stop:918 length:747 start_codon:yes stop_codon:yes gene_type:complete
MSSQNFLHDTLDAFSSATNEDEKWLVANSLARRIGGSSLTMGCIDVHENVPRWMRSTMPGPWLAEYVDKKYYDFDKLSQHTKASQTAFTVDVANAALRDDLGWYNLTHGLLDAGYKTLHLLPFESGEVNVRSAVTFNSEHPPGDILTSDFFQKVRILSTFMIAYIGAPGAQTSNLSGIVVLEKQGLSDRERQTIEYLSLGLRNIEIAHVMGIAEISVRKNILSVRKKLGAQTREQAIAIAVKRGLISP